MVAVARNAGRECVDGTVMATFRKCNVDLVSSPVRIFVNVPDPVAIQFNISETLMTPYLDGASMTPFGKPTSSSFDLTVFYEDGTLVSSYATEIGVVYYTANAACASIDNEANTMTIIDGATCTSVEVFVNVTIATFFFQGSNIVDVTRLVSLATFIDVHRRISIW